MPYFVYILYSEKADRYYIGSTSDVDKRLQKHNLGGTASTRPGRPWKLVYTETLQTKTDALVREKQIKKKKSRKYIEWLIRSDTEAVK
jgi:putative endonuclease